MSRKKRLAAVESQLRKEAGDQAVEALTPEVVAAMTDDEVDRMFGRIAAMREPQATRVLGRFSALLSDRQFNAYIARLEAKHGPMDGWEV